MFSIDFQMYPENILFAAGIIFALLTVFTAVYLLASRKRSRTYAEILRQETELFDALTATLHFSDKEKEIASINFASTVITSDSTASTSDSTVVTNQTQNQINNDGMFNPSVIAGEYDIEREIGGGAMSRTFVVRNKKLGNLWFLKFISSKDGSLANEQNILKLLNHICLPKIIDVYYREEGAYLVETLVDGISLNNLSNSGTKLNQYILADWFEQIAQALNYLHNMKPAPVLHLDLKPGNIMVTHDNRLVLVDFGISRHEGESATGAVTVAYAAPEQFKKRLSAKRAQIVSERFGNLPAESGNWKIDARTDIFSLGVVMFKLATEQLPTVKNLKILKNHVSKEFAEIILKCIEINPKDRYQSVAELLESLRKQKGSKVKIARSLFMRRVAVAVAIISLLTSGGTFAGGYYVFARESGATLLSQPDIVTVSLQQSTPFTVERMLPDGRIIVMETSQIQWENDNDNVAHIDGGRVSGVNLGETLITGRHRNNEVYLTVRVVEPIGDLIQISQRYQVGRSVSVFAGTSRRERVNGSISETNFFSPDSIASTADGTLYIADSGVIRRIHGGFSETVNLDIPYISVDMVRGFNNDIFIRTAPWQEIDGSYMHAIARVLPGGIVEKLYVADAVHTAIEDFAIGADGRVYSIIRNAGLNDATFLTAINNQDSIETLAQLPPGTSSIAIAEDGTIYIGNTQTGVVQANVNGEWRNFAGIENELAFIDGTSPRFYMPQRLEHHDGFLYVWDFNTLRRISAVGGTAGETVSIAGIASPVYEPEPDGVMFAAEDIILPHGRMMDFTVVGDSIYIADHKRGMVWEVS